MMVDTDCVVRRGVGSVIVSGGCGNASGLLRDCLGNAWECWGMLLYTGRCVEILGIFFFCMYFF